MRNNPQMMEVKILRQCSSNKNVGRTWIPVGAAAFASPERSKGESAAPGFAGNTPASTECDKGPLDKARSRAAKIK
jgi:hypothetical protein